MDYFVIEITKTTDSEVYATAITVKPSRDEAEALYHQILASALVNPAIEYALVKVDTIDGVSEENLKRVISRKLEPNEEEE